MENKIKEDEKSLRQQLDRLVEEELTGSSQEMPREIQFQPLMLESLPGQNLLGVVTVDGVLPSHLSLGLLSQLADLRDGASLTLEVAATRPGLGDSWQRRLVVTAVLQGEDGAERSLPVQRETKAGKVLLGFKAGLGVHSVSVLLYGQDILSSPFIIPVQTEPEKILAEVGLCFRGQSNTESRGLDRTVKVRLNSTTRTLWGSILTSSFRLKDGGRKLEENSEGLAMSVQVEVAESNRKFFPPAWRRQLLPCPELLSALSA